MEITSKKVEFPFLNYVKVPYFQIQENRYTIKSYNNKNRLVLEHQTVHNSKAPYKGVSLR